MLSKTVSEMELSRVSELVQLDEKETEEALSEACVSGMLWLKLDRVLKMFLVNGQVSV